jgi:ubiquinone/menaquinone biosynthesis C-methylase UbiE
MKKTIKSFLFKNWQYFHSIRKFELEILKNYLEIRKNDKVLDIGCGKGFFCSILKKAGCEVYGIDSSQESILTAKKYIDNGINFQTGVAENLPYEDNCFDKVSSICVIEHVNNDDLFVKEVKRVLKQGGIFAFSADSLTSKYFSNEFIQQHVKDYKVNILYDRQKIEKLLSDNEFEIIETEFLFNGYLSSLVIKFGNFFKYKSFFIILFSMIYPLLLLDKVMNKNPDAGFIVLVKARKK